MIVLPPALTAFAESLAELSGEVIRRYYRTPVPVELKKDESPVTLADKEAEEAMRQAIQAAYPHHGVLGEEHGASNVKAEFVWVLDPIDGTRSFIAGRPLFGTLIALLHDGVPVLGIIDQPISKERWVGVTGQVTTYNGAPIATRACKDVSHAMLSATTPHMFSAAQLARFDKVRKACRDTLYGGDCYAYGLVASGFMDMVIEHDLKAHDYCALVPVIEGAGGMVTDWSGQKLTLQSDGGVLACGTAELHAQALALLQG